MSKDERARIKASLARMKGMKVLKISEAERKRRYDACEKLGDRRG